MLHKEKVIKGLECCIKGEVCFSDCPYFKEVPMADGKCITAVQADALALLKEQPEIVRCKDCQWYDKRISMCDNCGLPREQMFFCADGERR